MNKPLRLTLFFLFLLSACGPVQKVAPEFSPDPLATRVEGDCSVTTHSFAAQGIPIPTALVVNPTGGGSPQLIWRDGSLLGSFETSSPLPLSNVHVIGSAAEAVAGMGLVTLGSDGNGATGLFLDRAGRTSLLVGFAPPVVFTGLVGIPQRPTVVYSTLAPSPQGTSLRSTLSLAQIEPSFLNRVLLEADRIDSRYLVPVAIHRDETDQADGVWYTTDLWGIGGDPLTGTRAGLYYLDLASGESSEFLSLGCGFSSLSTSQLYAAWTSAGRLYRTDLRTAESVSFTRLEGSDRGPALASLSPQDGYLAWLEGRGWQYDGTLETTLRIGIPGASLISDYPLSVFIGPAGLGEQIGLHVLGWLVPDDQVLLLAVFSVEASREVLVTLDPATGSVALLAEGSLVGLAYP